MKIMNLFVMCCVLWLTVPASAQLVPVVPQAKPIANPSMVIEDRGQKLEVDPALRAIPQLLAGGRVGYQLTDAAVTAPIDSRHLGVIYNHSIQAQGFITGEISFKIKGGGEPVGFDAEHYPGLVKLTAPAVYEVVARTPAEFIQLFKRLKQRDDLEWVEPLVVYGITLHAE